MTRVSLHELGRTARKLRGRRFAELRERTEQMTSARLERWGLSSRSRELRDAELDGLLDRELIPSTAPDAPLRHFRERSRPRFFAGFEDRGATLALLRQRCPDAEPSVRARADRIRTGRFDLLGHEQLFFGDPTDWQLDPMSGKRAPAIHWSRIPYLKSEIVGDHKVVWELNRHQYFLSLGQAYWYSGREEYAQTFARHLSQWMDANPPKRGINWASSLEVAFRAISWLWALHFFRDSAALTPALYRRVLAFLYVHARHLERYLSTYFSPNTHLTGEALGLLYLGTLLPEIEGATRWRETGWRILLEQLERQLLPDGVYFEQATYYQRYTADFYLHATILRDVNGAPVPPRVRARLASALDHLVALTRPDGTTPLIGDDDGGQLAPLDQRAPNDFRAVLATGAALLARADYAFAAGGLAAETIWLLGSAGVRRFESLAPAPPAGGSRAFTAGGYYVMRDGWGPDANHAVIDCGPHGTHSCGHAHADALAIEIAAQGRALLVDPGTYTYTASADERDRYRSTEAHNTLTVDATSSSEPAGPFAWGSIATATAEKWMSHPRFDFFEGSHDGYTRLPDPAVHRRSVLFLKEDYWIVRDRLEARGPHSVAIHFHAAPDVVATVTDPGTVELRHAGGGGLTLTAVAPGATLNCGDGWVSPAYGARRRAPVCTITLAGSGSQEVISVLVPTSVGEHHTVRATEIADMAGGGRLLVVAGSRNRDLLLVGDGVDRSFALDGERIDTDAAWLWLRHSLGGSAATEFCLVSGSYLALDGMDVLRRARRAAFAVGRRDAGEWLVEADGGEGGANAERESPRRPVDDGPDAAAVGRVGSASFPGGG